MPGVNDVIPLEISMAEGADEEEDPRLFILSVFSSFVFPPVFLPLSHSLTSFFSFAG